MPTSQELDAATLKHFIAGIVRIDEDKQDTFLSKFIFTLKPIPEVEQVTA